MNEPESLLIKFLLTLGFLIVLAFFVSIIATFLVSGKWKINWVAVVLSILFSAVTVSSLHSKSYFFKEEAVVPALIHKIKELLPWEYGASGDTGYIKDQLVFVNTALNPVLVEGPEGMSDDSAMHVITDRNKLLRLFHFLNQNNHNISLVACDLLFTDATKYDGALIQELREMTNKGKLVLAYNRDFAKMYPEFYGGLDLSCFGDVTKVKGETFYFSHKLLSEENLPSFSYAMYQKLKKPKLDNSGLFIKENNRYVSRDFITEFYLTNEEALYGNEPADNLQIKTNPDTAFTQVNPSKMYTLGNIVTPSGMQEFKDLTKQKGVDRQSIVFIGNFSDAFTDRHATAYGVLYGSTILLNEFYYIDHGYHAMSIWKMCLYGAFLLVGYFFIFKLLIKRAFDQSKHPATKELLKPSKSLFGKETLELSLELALASLTFILLFLLAFLIDTFFGRIVNIMALLYFFVPFDTLLKLFLKRYATAAPIANISKPVL